MRRVTSFALAEGTPLGRGVAAAFQATLLLCLLMVPTAFGHLHRYGAPGLLLVVCLLLAFWVVASLQGYPLRHVRAPVNLAVWLLMGLVLAQVLPLPKVGVVGQGAGPFGALRALLVNLGDPGRRYPSSILAVGRYSIMPGATVSFLVLMVSAAGLFWVLGSAVSGRRNLRRATWVALLGLAAVAAWVALQGLRARVAPLGAGPRVEAPMQVLGGDSLVPALLAAMPLGLLAVLRSLAEMPGRPAGRPQTRLAWLGRAGAVWGVLGLAMTLLVAFALGISHVPLHVTAGCAALSVAFVAVGYAGPAGVRFGWRGVAVRLGVPMVLIAAAIAAGVWAGGRQWAPAHTKEGLETLWGAMGPRRALFGAGAGAISPTAAFGSVGWPTADGQDGDTSGYRLLRTEIGLVGVALVSAGVLAMVVGMLRARRRGRGPWTRLAPLVGLGALAANVAYFGTDASALLAPNLVALAAVFGLVTAWGAYGANWRPDRRRELADAHWPFVVGAVAMLGAFGLAETEMLGAASPEMSDKILHFGTFAIVSLLLCYALGPQPGTHRLKTRIVLAVAGTAALGVVMEFGQRYLTSGRSFETMDMVANVTGAVLMGALWWLFRRTEANGEGLEPAPA